MPLDDEMVKDILKHVDGDKAVKLSQQMVRIKSPTFNESHSETELALFIADYMKGVGMEVQVQEVMGAKQAIGRYKGSGKGPSLMFNGHLDTNLPAAGGKKDPYGGIVENGWLYGAGSANMKCGDAAMITAATAVHATGIKLKGDLMVSCVMGELLGGHGTKHMLESGIVPDMVIDTEPTEMNLATQHPGVFQALIHTHGRVRHFSGTQKGVHALEKMIKVINALGPSMTPMDPNGWLKFKPSPVFPGFPQFNIGAINAGIGKEYNKRPTLMPELCTAYFDCRYIPGQSVASVKRDLEAVIRRLSADDPDLKAEVENPIPGFVNMPALGLSDDDPLVKTLAKWSQFVTEKEPEIGAKVGGGRIGGAADTGHFAGSGARALCYGPGGKYLNDPDERVSVEDIVNTAKVLTLVAADMLS